MIPSVYRSMAVLRGRVILGGGKMSPSVVPVFFSCMKINREKKNANVLKEQKNKNTPKILIVPGYIISSDSMYMLEGRKRIIMLYGSKSL